MSAEALVAVQALQRTYGDLVTRQDWEGVAGLFLPDATVTLDLGRGEPRVLAGGRALADFVAAAVARFDLFLFTVLNLTAELDADELGASGRVYLAELRQEGGRASVAYGLYDDRYAATPDGWRIAGRRYRSLARTAPPGSGADLEVVGSPGDQGGHR